MKKPLPTKRLPKKEAVKRVLQCTGHEKIVFNSLNAVARACGTSTQTLFAWRSKGCPFTAENTIDLKDLIQWLMGRRDKPKDALHEQKLSEEIRRLRNENDMSEGKLLPADQVFREIVQWATRIRSGLTGLGAECAILVPSEMKAVVKTQIEKKVQSLLKQAINEPIVGEAIDKLILQWASEIGKDYVPHDPIQVSSPNKDIVTRHPYEKEKAKQKAKVFGKRRGRPPKSKE